MSEQWIHRLAKPMLLAAALIWGSSFVVMKNTVAAIPLYYLLAIRFTLGAVLLSVVFRKKWKLLVPGDLWRGALIGGCLFLAYVVQTYGLMGTTPSKNAFLTAVYCVMVPFQCWAVLRRKPDLFHVMAAVLCVCGVGFVSLTEQFTVSWGDGLTLISAFFYAAHIVAVERTSEGKDIYLLTILQFIFAAIYSWIGVLISGDTLPELQSETWLSLLYLGVMATAVALLFQNIGQVHSDPASASVLLSLESVFGVIFSVLQGERVSFSMVIGFALIFLAVLCSETKFSFLRKFIEKSGKP